jgi:hypothetical protein
MTTSTTTPSLRHGPWWTLFFAGCYGASWQIVALIIAINTGYAAMMSIEDTRPFWHPFITTQCFGLSIAYFVNAAAPWHRTRPVLRLAIAVAAGTLLGYILVFAVKGAIIGEPGYAWIDMFSDADLGLRQRDVRKPVLPDPVPGGAQPRRAPARGSGP